jgi:2-polyprenyl-3-methyl-5-hydroxy-6-metoxy-1,4-benzoquinol methylase
MGVKVNLFPIGQARHLVNVLGGEECTRSDGFDLEQRAFLGDLTDARLLDLGCGDGFELVELARAGAGVTGAGNSPVQLAAAQWAAGALGIRVRLI